MKIKINIFVIVLFALTTTPAVHAGSATSWEKAWGALFQAAPSQNEEALISESLKSDAIHRWNRIAIDSSGLDHTPVRPGEIRVFGEQLGPGRSSRAMAIVHIAIFDAANAILGGYRSYTK